MTGKPTTDYIEATDGTGTPPGKTKAQVLSDVFSLATEFSTCVEAFNRIHPHKDNDHAQKVALAKLGLQQGRLLIFGDALGISAPPANIARHMIPSHPGLTNPDPHLPVNFGVRDARLDEEVIDAKIRAALHEMAGRPTNMSRDELMNAYGLKSPKAFSKLEYPALDTNRLEGFREKYNLLQDLVKQTGARTSLKRSMSMTTSHWTVRDSAKFEHYVKTVRTEVDALIDLMDVKEQVDRGIRSDLKSMGWHPDLTGRLVQQDWEKLKIIREACEVDYPEYLEVIDKALQYISEEVKETSLAQHRAALPTAPSAQEATSARRKSDNDVRNARRTSYRDVPEGPKSHLQLAAERALDPNYGKEKRPGWLSPTYSWFTGNNQVAASHDANETQETPTKTSDSRRNSTSNGAANSRRNSTTRRMSSSRRNSASHDATDARRKSASHELEDARRSNSTSSAYKAIPEGPKTHLQLAAERALSPHAGQEKRPGWLSPTYSWFSGSHDAGSQEATSPRETTASHDAIEARRRSASQEVADAYRSSSVSSAYKAIPEAPKTHLQLAAERALDPYAGQERRPSWLSMFKFKSWTKSGKQTETMQRSNSVSGAEAMDTQRSHSVGGYLEPLSEETNTLEPTRSKSLSAIPLPATNDLDVRMGKLSHEPAIQENDGEVTTYPERKPEGEELKKVDTVSSDAGHAALQPQLTANSYIDRHDYFPNVGRIETKDIRHVAHTPGL